MEFRRLFTVAPDSLLLCCRQIRAICLGWEKSAVSQVILVLLLWHLSSRLCPASSCWGWELLTSRLYTFVPRCTSERKAGACSHACSQAGALRLRHRMLHKTSVCLPLWGVSRFNWFCIGSYIFDGQNVICLCFLTVWLGAACSSCHICFDGTQDLWQSWAAWL